MEYNAVNFVYLQHYIFFIMIKGKRIRRKTPFKKKKVVRIRVPRTRNANTLTESAFWQMIRAALRNRTKFWRPKLNALKAARRPSQSSNKRLKWEFQCSNCKHWFQQSSIQVHHSLPAGQLNSYDDLPDFVRNLFAEDGWICLCKQCHKKEHKI